MLTSEVLFDLGDQVRVRRCISGLCGSTMRSSVVVQKEFLLLAFWSLFTKSLLESLINFPDKKLHVLLNCEV